MYSSQSIAEFVRDLRSRGTLLWPEGERICYRSPRGVIGKQEFEILSLRKHEILAHLAVHASSARYGRSAGSGAPPTTAPLSFSQQLHWNLFHLEERRSGRHVMSVTRIVGKLNLDGLRRGASALIRRHEALRTRIFATNGVPMQEVTACDDCAYIAEEQPAGCRDFDVSAVTRALDRDVLEPVNLATDPLIKFSLLRFNDADHVLIVTMDHMISDGFSMNILLRDLFAAYALGVNDIESPLPELPLQFSEYARQQRKGQEAWIARHSRYWNAHLGGMVIPRVPADKEVIAAAREGWGTVSVEIDRPLKLALEQWCRQYRTTIVMTVFSCYALILLRACRASEMIVQYQINGRAEKQTQNAIGYFASVLYLRVAITPDDTFPDLVRRITEEYCRAYEHADSNYLATQVPRPDFARCGWFNWIPEEPAFELSGGSESLMGIECQPLYFRNPAAHLFDWDNDPELVLFEMGNRVVGELYFPLNRFTIRSMEMLSRQFLSAAWMLVRNPVRRLHDLR